MKDKTSKIVENRVGLCDGVSVRIFHSQCLKEDYGYADLDFDVKGTFSFMLNEFSDHDSLKREYPAMASIDFYGHTAVDGFFADQMVDVELPKLKQLAANQGLGYIIDQIDKLLDFINKNYYFYSDSLGKVSGDHRMLFFDGM